MVLYVTRHGETIWNTQNKVCGREDVLLTTKGQAQAHELAKKVSDLDITKVICSPLQRAYLTAEIIANKQRIPLTVDSRLLEVDFGDFDGHQCNDSQFLVERANFAVRFPNGESLFDVVSRVYPLLEELVKLSEESVLIVCHNALMRVIHSYFNNMANNIFFEFNSINCEMRKYEI